MSRLLTFFSGALICLALLLFTVGLPGQGLGYIAAGAFCLWFSR